jgi:hypothetical protein
MNPEILEVNSNIGNVIRFRITHPTDTAPIVGKLVGVCDARTAMLVGSDIAHMHIGIEQQRVTLGLDVLGPYNTFTFIIIEKDGGKRAAYALEWITPDGYELVTGTQTIDIRLRNVTQDDVAQVLAALHAMHISAKVVV